MARSSVWFALAMITGCYSPSPDNGVLLCSTDKKCPDGYHCAADDHCYHEGAQPAVDMAAPAATAVDKCGGDLPVHLSSGDVFIVDTTNFTDDFSQLKGCTPRNEPGNDGFFAVDMAAGERWHFHVKVPTMNTAQYDPALYILPSCDDRACKPSASQDECGPGRDEHLSYIAGPAGRYIVGVDSSLVPGGAPWSVLAIHPTCGNKVKEHSESCDDGNAISGDGCSAACSTELGDGAMEAEPNDDAIGSNPIMFQPGPTGAATVIGAMKHGCDFDVFSVTVPANGSIEATVFDGMGQPCTVMNQVELLLIGPDRETQKGVGVAGMMNTCPAIGADPVAFKFAQGLAAGTYYLKVRQLARDSADPVNYRLRAEVKP